jgi:hypothetical protein
MKSQALLAAILVMAFCAPIGAQTWQDVSSHIFTNAAILWNVPSNTLPEKLWVYRRILPHVFSSTVISNAIVFGSLQNRGFPRPSTNDFYIWEKVPPNWPGIIAPLLGVLPSDATLFFSVKHFSPVSAGEIPDDAAIVKRALEYAPMLGLAPTNLTTRRFYTHLCDTDNSVNNLCGRGVFFPRCLDGIEFFSAADDGESAEGFSMELGSHGKIQAFSVRWSKMERFNNERTASQGEITRCIKAHKAIVMPNFKDGDFARLRELATAKKFTIIKITPYYSEGMFGDMPTNGVPCGFAMPFVELEAVADFGISNAPVKLLSPILSSEIRRLLAERVKLVH